MDEAGRKSWTTWLVRDVESGTVGMASVAHFAQWMGLRGTEVEAAIKEELPCYGTGSHVGPDGVTRRCGYCSWCENCETSIDLIGKAWMLPMMEDAVAQTLLLAVRGWLLADPTVRFWPFETPVHECGGWCGGYRIVGGGSGGS